MEESKMKFLVLGSAGMAGHTISIYLAEQGHIVDGFDKTNTSITTNIVGNVRDISNLKKIIQKGKYNSVINCIGVLNQSADKNKELAVFLNSYLPHLLADVTKTLNTKKQSQNQQQT